MIKNFQNLKVRRWGLLVGLAALGLIFATAASALSQVTRQTSVYGGTARISDLADAMELGGPGTWPLAQPLDGPYLLSSGSIFLVYFLQ